MLRPGSFSVPVGGVESRCHVQLAGDGSVLPAGSIARIWTVWRPSVRPLTNVGLEHALQAPPSAWHPNVEPVSVEVKEKETLPPLGSAGFAVIVVSGGVVSTLTLRIADAACPALSVAVALSAWLPSPGIAQLTAYGPGEATVPSELNVPLPQSMLVFEHSKNCTFATPLPASVALAVNGVGLENEPLTDVGGGVIETVGATLSTRVF